MGNGMLDFEKPIWEMEQRIRELRSFAQGKNMDFSEEIAVLEEKVSAMRQQIYSNLSRWQRVRLARHPERPYALDYITRIFRDFLELHGDRYYGDDPAIVGGLAYLDDLPVTVIGQQKGRDTRENIRRHFGMPYPEGYRKARRLMAQAEKFGRPVICFIDTPGAFPGLEGEKRGQAEAIATNLAFMAGLEVPTLGVLISEGGSGGALGIGVTDRLLMLENAYYSVISPEGCAAILWRDAAYAAEAADALKLTAQDLYTFGVVDEVIPEPTGGAHRDYEAVAAKVKAALQRHLRELLALDAGTLRAMRYEKYRRLGVFNQAPATPGTPEGDGSA